MTPFVFETWDDGRLRVNCAFAPLLQQHQLTTFDALLNFSEGQIAREIGVRVTKRIVLTGTGGSGVFYLKRHGALPLWEYLKPLLRLNWPVHGARNEWDAILRFHEAGLPTMTPVAMGVSGRRSFLMTQSLEGRQSLLEWVENAHPDGAAAGSLTAGSPPALRRVTEEVARIARTMHAAGLHHQDFYLNHLLMARDPNARDLRVIDLGRVRLRRPLSARWIVKDLAQLDFSARKLSCTARLRFLRLYLGRPFTENDRMLVRRVSRKAQWIARHTKKHSL